MFVKTGLSIVAILVLFSDADGSCEADNHVNGCSIPLNAPFPYKANFRPACNKHDICYYCGQRYGWSRSDCDIAFRRDMDSICESLFAGRKRSYWAAVRNAWKVASEIAKWPSVSGKVAHCKQGSKIYYMSVDFFGQDNYSNSSPAWCNNACVIAKGSPATRLLKK